MGHVSSIKEGGRRGLILPWSASRFDGVRGEKRELRAYGRERERPGRRRPAREREPELAPL